MRALLAVVNDSEKWNVKMELIKIGTVLVAGFFLAFVHAHGLLCC